MLSMSRSWLFFATVPTAGIAYLVYIFWRPPWTPLRIAGLVLLFLGLVFLTVARFQLGNSFSLTPQARQLVTHGLYSRIRNPVYVFGALTVLGLFPLWTGPTTCSPFSSSFRRKSCAPAPKPTPSKPTSVAPTANTNPKPGSNCVGVRFLARLPLLAVFILSFEGV